MNVSSIRFIEEFYPFGQIIVFALFLYSANNQWTIHFNREIRFFANKRSSKLRKYFYLLKSDMKNCLQLLKTTAHLMKSDTLDILNILPELLNVYV